MTRYFTGDRSFTGHRPAPADGLEEQLSGANTANLAEFSGTANLVVLGGPNDGVMFPIPGDGLTLGRLPDNDVVIDDPWVSRRHAEIISTHDSFVLRDLASSNGTFLTDRQIDASDCGLQDGDHIRLGQSDIQLVFRFSGAATLRMAPRTGDPDRERDQISDGATAARRARQAVKRDKQAQAKASESPVPDRVTVREDSEPGEALAEGEVRLNVEAGGDVRLIYQFVHELRQKPEFSVLRMSGGPEQRVAVWIGLADGTPLKPILSDMKYVSDVSQGADQKTGVRAAGKVYDISLAI